MIDDVGSSEEDVALAERLLALWANGEGTSKSQIEIEEWDDATAHGRHFDRFIRTHLGVSTSRPSKQTSRIADLEQQIRGLGEQPNGTEAPLWEVQVQHARSACVAAIRIWNDPSSRFRTGAFSLLFITAWNSLAIAVLEHEGKKWWDEPEESRRDTAMERYALDINNLLGEAFPGDANHGLRSNIALWVEIRNAVAHRYLPALDSLIIPNAQAGLLNFEEVLVARFGDHYALAASLTVPLQLSGFRDANLLASRKKMQASLPLDVQAILAGPLESSPELAADRTFQMRVAFVPVVPASGRSPDAISYFVKPDEVPTELEEVLERYVVLPKVGMTSRPNFSPTDVVQEFARRTGYKLNMAAHAQAGRVLGARTPKGQEDATTNYRFAEYMSSFKAYRYSQAWIDELVATLGDPEEFERVTGKPPRPV